MRLKRMTERSTNGIIPAAKGVVIALKIFSEFEVSNVKFDSGLVTFGELWWKQFKLMAVSLTAVVAIPINKAAQQKNTSRF